MKGKSKATMYQKPSTLFCPYAFHTWLRLLDSICWRYFHAWLGLRKIILHGYWEQELPRGVTSMPPLSLFKIFAFSLSSLSAPHRCQMCWGNPQWQWSNESMTKIISVLLQDTSYISVLFWSKNYSTIVLNWKNMYDRIVSILPLLNCVKSTFDL